MTIEKNFPLECCNKCKSLRAYTTEQMLYGEFEVVDRVITIGCEHEQECMAIYKMLADREPKKEQMAAWEDCHCMNCKCDMPAFISGSRWRQFPTKYCPSCGAKMANGTD